MLDEDGRGMSRQLLSELSGNDKSMCDWDWLRQGILCFSEGLLQDITLLLLQQLIGIRMEAQQPLQHQKIPIQIPDPVYYGAIKFLDGEKLVEYTDCWEISVLRLLHCFFGRGGVIDHFRLTAFMEQYDPHCQALIEYFTINPNYHIKEAFYKSEEGWALRAKWCQFLNGCDFFSLKKEGKYEVAATFPNTFAFFKGFFPKLKVDWTNLPTLTLDSVLSKEYFEQCVQKLNEIYSQLSEWPLHAEMEASLIHQGAFLFFSANQKLHLQGKHLLDWEISEHYNVGEEVQDRQGGHSDYRYARK